MLFDLADNDAPLDAGRLIDNLLPSPLGGLTRRLGRTRRWDIAQVGTAHYDFFRWYGSDKGYRDVVYYTNGTNAYASVISGSGAASTSSALTNNTRAIGMQAKYRLILCNGADNPICYSYSAGVTVRAVGLGTGPAVSSATPANGTGAMTGSPATYTYKLTVLYGDDGESNPGTASSTVTMGASDNEVALSWSAPTPPTGMAITGYRIWRRRTDSGNDWGWWFLVAQVNATSYTDRIADTTVYASGAGTTVQDNHNAPPGKLTGMVWWDFENRAVGWGELSTVSAGEYPNRLWFSDTGKPELWRTVVDGADATNTAEFIDVPQEERDNPVISVVPVGSSLYVFNRYGVRVVVVDSDGGYQVVQVANSSDHGIIGPKAVSVADTGEVFYVSTEGIRRIRGRVEVEVESSNQDGSQNIVASNVGSRIGTAVSTIIDGIPESMRKHVSATVFRDQLHVALATSAVGLDSPSVNNDVLIFDLKTGGFFYSSGRNVNGWCIQNDSGNPYTLISAGSVGGMSYAEYSDGQNVDEDADGEEVAISWRFEDFHRVVAAYDIGILSEFIFDASSSGGVCAVLFEVDGERTNQSFAFSYESGGLRYWQDSGYLDTDVITDDLATFQAITDGEFEIEVDGTPQDVTGLDFSTSTDFDEIAGVITDGLTGATCRWWEHEEKFRIQSETTGATSTVDSIDSVSGGAGTDISGMLGTGTAVTVASLTAGRVGLVWWGEGVSDPTDEKYFWSGTGGMRSRNARRTFNGIRGSQVKLSITGTNAITIYGYRLGYDVAPASARGVS